MFKTFTSFICLLFSITGFGTANSVYHEFTMNSTGGACGTFVNNITPATNDPVSINFTIDYQLFTNQARIYYTTDGSTPSAAFGVPSGTTQVITATYACTFNNGTGTVDVAQGTIPGLPTGTVVKYIVSAWHSSGGLEIFASGGSNTNSASATVFTYTVASVLPISMISFSAKKETDAVKLIWTTAREINTQAYEIYSSKNGVDFKIIGSKAASGTTSFISEYLFTDTKPVSGYNFYKIKTIDKDGHFYNSGVISVWFENNSSSIITVAANVLHIRLNSSQKGNYVVSMINNSGQSIKNWNISGSNNSSDHYLDLPLYQGKSIYHFTIKGNATIYSRTMFIW